MAWKTIKASQIPAKNSSGARNSWKPDVDDVTAVFSMMMNGDEAIIQKMPDSNSASKKAEAMLKWIKTQTILPATLTAFVRNNCVVITDIELMAELSNGQE